MAALQDYATLDLNDQNDVQIQFIVDEDFTVANFTEHRTSDHECYSDEWELSSEDSSEDEQENSEGLPGVLGNKGTQPFTFREQGISSNNF